MEWKRKWKTRNKREIQWEIKELLKEEKKKEKPTKCFVSPDHWEANELLKWLPVYLWSHPNYLICSWCLFPARQHNNPKWWCHAAVTSISQWGFPAVAGCLGCWRGSSQSQQVRHKSPLRQRPLNKVNTGMWWARRRNGKYILHGGSGGRDVMWCDVMAEGFRGKHKRMPDLTQRRFTNTRTRNEWTLLPPTKARIQLQRASSGLK